MFMAGKDLRVKNKVKYVTSASSLFFMQGEKVKWKVIKKKNKGENMEKKEGEYGKK